MFIPFGEYKPDTSSLDQGSTSLARNAVPGASGDYLPLPSLVEHSTPHPDRVRGAVGVFNTDRTSALYAGTQNTLWQSSGTGWLNRGAGYTMTGSERWSFTQYRDKIIAASAENPVQIGSIGGPAFAAMITSARRPRARYVAVVNREWVVLGNCIDDVDGERPGRVWYLARGNPAHADPDVNAKSGFEDLDSEDGPVLGIVGAEYGTIVCNKAIWRMTYEGSDVVYRFDKVIRNKGAISGGTIVGFGRTVFFWDDDGPYVFDGTRVDPIGDGKVASTVVNQINHAAKSWISSAVFPRQTVVAWAMPTGSEYPDKIYMYNWKTGRWSFAEVNCEMIFSTHTAAMLLDSPGIFDYPIDIYPRSEWPLDGAQFVGGIPVLAAFGVDHKLKFFNGPPMEAVIETAEISPFVARRASVTSVRPIVEGTNDLFVSVLSRDDIASSPTQSVEATTNMIGAANIWAQGRFLRTRVRIPNGFNHAIGVDTEFKREGVR